MEKNDKKIIDRLDSTLIQEEKLRVFSLYYLIKNLVKEDIEKIYGKELTENMICASFQLVLYQIEQMGASKNVDLIGRGFLTLLKKEDVLEYEQVNKKIDQFINNMNTVTDALSVTDHIEESSLSLHEQAKLSTIVLDQAIKIDLQSKLLGQDRQFTKEILKNTQEYLAKSLSRTQSKKNPEQFEQGLVERTKNTLIKKHNEENIFRYIKQDNQVKGFINQLSDEEIICWEYESIFELSGFGKDTNITVLERKEIREEIAKLMNKSNEEVDLLSYLVVNKRLGYRCFQNEHEQKDVVKLFRKNK